MEWNNNPGRVFWGVAPNLEPQQAPEGYRRTVQNDIINDKMKNLSEKKKIKSRIEMEFERKLDKFQVGGFF